MKKLVGLEYIKLVKTCGIQRRILISDKSIPSERKHTMITEVYLLALLGTDYQQMYVDIWIDALQKEVKSK